MSVIIDNEIALVGDTMFGVFKGFVFLPYAEDVKKVIHSLGDTIRNRLYTVYTFTWFC